MDEPDATHPTRREFLSAVALGAAGSLAGRWAWGADPTAALPAAPRGHGFAVVATDGSGDFGPKTPGTRTGGIQEAIDHVHRSGGGVVLLRRGVHLVSNVQPPPADARRFDTGQCGILLCSDLTLRGEGLDQAVIRTAKACNINALFGWQVSRVTIEDLTVDCAGLNKGYGIAIFGMGMVSMEDVYLRRVKATGAGGSAIAVAGGRRVVLDSCVAEGGWIGYELGAPSEDYHVLNCSARGCGSGCLIFDGADKYNEAGNLRPRVVGGVYDGGGTATPVALWDCWEPVIEGVVARKGTTTDLQISSTHRATITTPVGGGLIAGCLAEGSVGSPAGRYGIGALQDGVRVLACSAIGNDDTGVLAAPGEGGRVSVSQCLFRPGDDGRQRYAIAAGAGVVLRARDNLWRPAPDDGKPQAFLGNTAGPGPGSLLADNEGYNPVGLVEAPAMGGSGAFAANSHPFAVEVFVAGGRVSRVEKRDGAGRVAVIARADGCSVRLMPGEALAVTYDEAPEWSWFGL